jgi:hypothetical protein
VGRARRSPAARGHGRVSRARIDLGRTRAGSSRSRIPRSSGRPPRPRLGEASAHVRTTHDRRSTASVVLDGLFSEAGHARGDGRRLLLRRLRVRLHPCATTSRVSRCGACTGRRAPARQLMVKEPRTRPTTVWSCCRLRSSRRRRDPARLELRRGRAPPDRSQAHAAWARSRRSSRRAPLAGRRGSVDAWRAGEATARCGQRTLVMAWRRSVRESVLATAER